MKANVVEIRELCNEIVALDQIPNGTYDGIWGGYNVRFGVGERNFEVKTDIGIRTMSAPCNVCVSNGNITITTR